MKKKIYLCSWLLVILNISIAQSFQDISIDKSNSQDEIVNTPFGPAHKSNVHYIDTNHYINNKSNNIQIVRKGTNKISKEFYNDNNKGTSDFKIESQNNLTHSNSYFKDGWITFAYGDFFSQDPLSFFNASWIA